MSAVVSPTAAPGAAAGDALVIRIHPNDDVVIARRQLVGGTRIESEGITVVGLIPPGHKVATRAIAAGAPVRRYDQIIGSAKQAIAPGQHVHTHNLEFSSFAREYAAASGAKPTEYVAKPATFNGIVRADGRIATRNYIGILTSVNCSATVARAIADHFRRDTNPRALERFPNVDGVIALTHGAGCATDSAGEPLQVLRRTLGGYARHPNFASVMVVGLGCETNQISGLIEQEKLGGAAYSGPTLHSFNIQETGGTRKTVAHGIELVEWLLEEANKATRTPVPASHIMVGLQCGGSDGYSGISANPALGAAVDRLVRHGGTAILSETPEIYGGEHLLTRRAVSQGRRRQAGRAHPLVGALLRAQRRGDGQQPVGRQQGRRPDDDPREEPRRDRQERNDQPRRRRRVRAARHCQGPGVHGHAGLRPGLGDRPGGRRRQPDLLHHRARLGLRLRAFAVAQALDQHRALDLAGRRHRHQLRRRRRRHGRASTRWASASSG